MRRLAIVLALVIACTGVAAAAEVHLRVMVPQAQVRTGPAAAYRTVYVAQRGEIMRVVDRNADFWFRVVLPDGRFGWIYGEQAIPFEVDPNEGTRTSRAWRKFRDAVFSPSPIPAARAGFTFSGGVLGGDGMFMFRPAVTLDSHFAIEGHIGDAVGSDGSLLVYGIGGNILLWPLGPVVPFVSLGAGGATSFPKINGVTQESKTNFALDAGGGLAVILRKRIVVRFDVRNYTLFTANSTENRQEYSGGLAVFF